MMGIAHDKVLAAVLLSRGLTRTSGTIGASRNATPPQQSFGNATEL
jgi:hypothetical protein